MGDPYDFILKEAQVSAEAEDMLNSLCNSLLLSTPTEVEDDSHFHVSEEDSDQGLDVPDPFYVPVEITPSGVRVKRAWSKGRSKFRNRSREKRGVSISFESARGAGKRKEGPSCSQYPCKAALLGIAMSAQGALTGGKGKEVAIPSHLPPQATYNAVSAQGTHVGGKGKGKGVATTSNALSAQGALTGKELPFRSQATSNAQGALNRGEGVQTCSQPSPSVYTPPPAEASDGREFVTLEDLLDPNDDDDLLVAAIKAGWKYPRPRWWSKR